MPHVRLQPDKTDRAIVKEFIRSVSWGSTCLLVQDLSNGRVHLFTNHYVLVPVHYSQLEESLGYIAELANRLNTKPGVIIHGDCSDAECERLSWVSHGVGFVTMWLGVHQRLFYDHWLVTGALDGIEWWNLN